MIKDNSQKARIIFLLEFEKRDYEKERDANRQIPDYIHRNMAALLQMQINTIESIINKIKNQI